MVVVLVVVHVITSPSGPTSVVVVVVVWLGGGAGVGGMPGPASPGAPGGGGALAGDGARGSLVEASLEFSMTFAPNMLHSEQERREERTFSRWMRSLGVEVPQLALPDVESPRA